MSKNNNTKCYCQSLYKNNRLRWAAAMTFMLLNLPGNLVGSWLLGAIIDVIAVGNLSQLAQLVWVAVAIIVGFTLLGLANQWARAGFIYHALQQYKALAFQKLSEKGISAFARENTGRYISILTNDVNSVEENYLKRTFDLVYFSLLFAATLVMMFFYNVPLTLFAIALSGVSIAVSLPMSGEMSKREMAVSNENERFVGRVKELLGGFEVIKSFKVEKEAQSLFNDASQAAEQAKYRRRWWDGVLVSIGESMCGTTLQLGVFLFGGYLAIRGDITAGTVLIFTNLCNFLTVPISLIPPYWASRKAAKGLIEKLAQVVEENTGHAGETVPPVLDEAIAFDHLSFAYTPGQPVLQDISMRLEAGKKYALVGASGSGKSTLLNLLMGAYPDYQGSLTVDGREMNTLDPDSLYDLISLIGQNVFLFDDTIARNIAMFRDFPAERVASAAERSGLAALIAEKGPDYRCGENGVLLSGGERQRISIARCLLRETPVLLLDEATASLDSQTAFAVVDSILHLDGLTRLVVTHRLERGLLEQYDEIFVLRSGRLCERGGFQELMDKKGYFYSLFTISDENA